jgi:hypothetical protein
MFSPVSWSGRPARWLKITAALEIVLAAVFFFIGWQNEILRGGFYLTAAILGGLGVLLWLWGGRMAKGYENAQRIKMQGVPGQAQIVGLRQTGMTMNEQPQIELTLNVQTQMHGTYQATLKEWVPLMMLGRLTSGLPLPVKVDPANAQNIVIEWESAMSPMAGVPGSAPGAMSMGGMQGAMAPSGDPQDVKKRLLAEGTSGTAKVLSAQNTGQIDGEGRTVYDMVLQVDVPGRPSMQAPARVGIPPERVEQLEPGDSVPVKVDPNNPAMMAVDWDSA